MTISEIIEGANSLEDLISHRAGIKVDAQGHGFGRCNSLESISFEDGYVLVQFTDYCYDLRDTCSVSLSTEELEMSNDQFSTHIEKIRDGIIKKKEEALKRTHLDEVERRRKQYEKLKKEFEK